MQKMIESYNTVDISTNEETKWTLVQDKELVDDVAHTDIYESGDRRSLLKKNSSVSKNIAEFFAGKLYQAIIPEAKTYLTRVGEKTGNNVYIVSEYIPSQPDLRNSILSKEILNLVFKSHSNVNIPNNMQDLNLIASELDKLGGLNLEKNLDEIFEEMQKFYSIKRIINFAVRAGFCKRPGLLALNVLANHPELANDKINEIKVKALNILKQRQKDLLDISAQFKLNSCVKTDSVTHQSNLNGQFENVVFDHFDYFKALVLGEKSCTFGKSYKNHVELNNEFKTRTLLVMASIVSAVKGMSVHDALRNLEKPGSNADYLDIAPDENVIEKAKGLLKVYEDEYHDLVIKILVDSSGCIITEPQKKMLQENKTLRDALLAFNDGCNTIYTGENQDKINALQKYKSDTFEAAMQGQEKFKDSYKEIKKNACKIMDDSKFTAFARLMGNILVTALATVSVVGIIGMALTSKQRGGLLLFQSAEQKFAKNAASLADSVPSSSKPDVSSNNL